MEEPILRAGNHSGGNSNSITKRVALQNQVLKWLQGFSDKVEQRAKGAAAQVDGLLEEASALELDMKTTLISFDNLTRERFVEHKISDEGDMTSIMRDNTQSSPQSQVPAQDYERDILPRYKEALHIGLASCKDHFQKKGRSTSSVFRAMPAYGPLPHIIGSEEYNHDNSCGLADDLQPLTDDFNWLREIQGESSDAEAPDLFGSHMLEVQQGFGKGGTEPLVSAAREFKAMLEAALVNPYKFYDDASMMASHASVESSSSEVHHNTEPVMLGKTNAICERSTEADNSEETQLLASLQNPETNVHDLYSALVTDSLFDAGDEVLYLDDKESDNTPISAPASGSPNPAIADSDERTLTVHETTTKEEEDLIGGVASSSSINDAHDASSSVD